jgi:hypothetical protein
MKDSQNLFTWFHHFASFQVIFSAKYWDVFNISCVTQFQSLDQIVKAADAANTFHSKHDNHANTIHVTIQAADHKAAFQSYHILYTNVSH